MPEWYKNDVIYNLDVKTFKDSDGDGRGDFKGLTSKLDYLQRTGVDIIWLSPFQPTNDEDDGYDVTDYYGIDRRLGTPADFKTFMAEAKKHHIKVIMDMVLNHTSIYHPWYIEASRNIISPKHNWYLWSVKRPDDWNKGMGFPVIDKETWKYDKTAKEYYFHRFYSFEPDLNYQNPAVIKEAEHILSYWLGKGIDGFRLDAVPFIIDDPRTSTEHPKQDFSILHKLASFAKQYKANVLLLGEANVTADESEKYFDNPNPGLQMMFNFFGNQYLIYGLATGESKPFEKALNITRLKTTGGQWAWFLRNHDEADLGRLSKRELKDVLEQFGPDTTMQLYKRGIRRRLAPMLGNNITRLKMAYSLLFSLPGTPVMRYGEEIGMGDDLIQKERLAIRTPMQWDSTVNSGFSTAQKTFRPMIDTGMYNYHQVNLKSEESRPGSLYNFIRQIISLRKKCPEIGEGNWQTIESGSNNILAIQYKGVNHTLIVCHNFSREPQQMTLKLQHQSNTQVQELITHSYSKINNQQINKKLAGYGFQWYQTTL